MVEEFWEKKLFVIVSTKYLFVFSMLKDVRMPYNNEPSHCISLALPLSPAASTPPISFLLCKKIAAFQISPSVLISKLV